MSAIKVYKLVPQKQFDQLLQKHNKNIFEGDNQPVQPQQKQLEESQRSVKSIQNENEMDYNDLSRQNNNLTELYSVPGTEMIKQGEGTTPLWIYDEQHTLPQYSKANKMVNSFSKYKNILKADMPENLKLTLKQYYNDKYNRSRESNNDLNTFDSDEENIQTTPQQAMNNYVDMQIGNSKKKLAAKVGEIMLNYPNHIRWDQTGRLTHPKFINTNVINLHILMSILIYVVREKEEQLQEVYNIIKPFYKKLLPFIKNKKVKQKIDLWEANKHKSNRNYIVMR